MITRIIQTSISQIHSQLEKMIKITIQKSLVEQEKRIVDTIFNRLKKELLETKLARKPHYWTDPVRTYARQHFHDKKFLAEFDTDEPKKTGLEVVLEAIDQENHSTLDLTPDEIKIQAVAWSAYARTIWSTLRSSQARQIEKDCRIHFDIPETTKKEERLQTIKIWKYGEEEVPSQEIPTPELIQMAADHLIEELMSELSKSDQAWAKVVAEFFLAGRDLDEKSGTVIWELYQQYLNRFQ
eukprot:TRINITY_DN1290_c0_g1_i1.p1 TRINITY_DN1290_c0_g1~~TRINITY_DN1290_c0_g1_i1.p1  ORF type:complete len:240 (+),score=33.28 TRINITY_DN1290_c0_g1_i1:403-1122(+)